MLKVLQNHIKTLIDSQIEVDKLVQGKTQLSYSAWVKCAKKLFKDRCQCDEFLAQLKASKNMNVQESNNEESTYGSLKRKLSTPKALTVKGFFSQSRNS